MANLRAYANEREVKIVGDLPIYVPLDSADVWSAPQEFQLDEQRRPRCVAVFHRTIFRRTVSSGATRSTTGTI